MERATMRSPKALKCSQVPEISGKKDGMERIGNPAMRATSRESVRGCSRGADALNTQIAGGLPLIDFGCHACRNKENGLLQSEK
jgi:hypothetical protein